MASSRSFGERVRRNHALEHATLHVLARDHPDLNLVGRSDWRGFQLYGEVDTETVQQAAYEGWDRLRSGQTELSIHPRCGTNLAVGIVLAGVAALLAALASRRDRWRRWPLTIFGIIGALSLANPLGPEVQRRMTTDPDMEGVFVDKVSRRQYGRWTVHQVDVRHEI